MPNLSLDRVVHQIGHGSFGVVVLAKDKATNAEVAIKLLHKDEDLQDDMEVEERLYRKLLAGCNRRVEYVLILLSSRLSDILYRYFARVIASGEHRGFHCVIFERCYSTLLDVVSGYCGLTPLPAVHVMEISYQLVQAVGCKSYNAFTRTLNAI